MYCSRCGSEISGDARYCQNCGARQEMGVMPAKEIISEECPNKRNKYKMRRHSRRMWNFLITMAALALLFTVDKEVPDAGIRMPLQMDAACFTACSQREMAICSAEGKTCITDIPKEILYSADHSRIAYIDQEKELYLMDGMAPVFVSGGVKAAKLSFYGKTIAFLRDTKEGGQELCIYTAGVGSVKQIPVESCQEFVLSTDGRTVAYIEAGGEGGLSLWHAGGRTARLSGDASELFSVSDGGKVVWYRKGGSLLIFAGSENREAAAVGGAVSCILNESQTEMLYTEDGGTWYCSAGQKEPVRLDGVKGTVLPDCLAGNVFRQQEHSLVLGRRTLKGMTFAARIGGDQSCKIYHLDESGEKAKLILNRAEQFQIAQDGQSLLYLAGQKLYRIRDVGRSQDRICLSGSMKAERFLADQALQKIWFVSPGHGLFYVKKDECAGLADNLGKLYGLYADGILFQEGKDLYYADADVKRMVKEDVGEAYIQEGCYAVVDTADGYCYLKDLKDEIRLMDSR